MFPDMRVKFPIMAFTDLLHLTWTDARPIMR